MESVQELVGQTHERDGRNLYFSGVERERVPRLWKAVLPWIRKGLQRGLGETGEDAVYSALMKEEMQLWVLMDVDQGEIIAAAVTEIVTHPLKKIAYFVTAAGREGNLWLDYMDVMQDWARSNGCSMMAAQGRPGWERVLEQKGFRKQQVVLTCDLEQSDG